MPERVSVLIVDDMPDLRSLVRFFLESTIECDITEASGGHEALALCKTKAFQLIVSDFHMPDGDGISFLRHLIKDGKCPPTVLLSGDNLEKYKDVLSQHFIAYVEKPFTHLSLQKGLQKIWPELLGSQPQYVPVRLDLLRKIKNIHVPLYLKLAEDKFVKIQHEETDFSTDEHVRFRDKNVEHLYIELTDLDLFLSEYQRQILSVEAWQEINFEDARKHISINAELMRSCAQHVGWDSQVLRKAQDNTQKALYLLTKNHGFPQLLNKFQKIEHFGFSDFATLISLITLQIAERQNLPADAIISLQFASILHDSLLSDELYSQRKRYVEMIRNGENLSRKDTKEFFAHPATTAQHCEKLPVCPPLSKKIIFQHHEWVDGKGFPMGLKPDQIHPLSALFIVAEDFAELFVESSCKMTVQDYKKLRRETFSAPLFHRYLESL